MTKLLTTVSETQIDDAYAATTWLLKHITDVYRFYKTLETGKECKKLIDNFSIYDGMVNIIETSVGEDHNYTEIELPLAYFVKGGEALMIDDHVNKMEKRIKAEQLLKNNERIAAEKKIVELEAEIARLRAI